MFQPPVTNDTEVFYQCCDPIVVIEAEVVVQEVFVLSFYVYIGIGIAIIVIITIIIVFCKYREAKRRNETC